MYYFFAILRPPLPDVSGWAAVLPNRAQMPIVIDRCGFQDSRFSLFYINIYLNEAAVIL